MNKYYDINKLPKEPITFIMGTRKNREQLASMYGVMLEPKKYKKRYHLRKEVIDSIIAILIFIGLLLIISGIEMLKF